MYQSFSDFIKDIKDSGKDWVKSQLKVSGITFVLLLVGIYAADAYCEAHYGSGIILDILIPLIAFAFAVVDAVPVIGISVCMLPWATLLTIFSDHRQKGLAVLIVFFVIMVVKQVLEPFIRGKSLGVSPLEEVVTAAIGWFILPYGLGVIIVPVAYTIGKKAYLKSKPQSYFDKVNQKTFNKDDNDANKNASNSASNVIDITDEVEDVEE